MEKIVLAWVVRTARMQFSAFLPVDEFISSIQTFYCTRRGEPIGLLT